MSNPRKYLGLKETMRYPKKTREKFSFDEMSSGKMSFWEKCLRGEQYPREKCYTGRNVVGRNVMGRNVIGEKNLWGETSRNLFYHILDKTNKNYLAYNMVPPKTVIGHMKNI